MQHWTISYLDETGDEQTIGFGHNALGATVLAEAFLAGRDAALALPWKRLSDNAWRMEATSLEDDESGPTLFMRVG